jgi:hypothetical protein
MIYSNTKIKKVIKTFRFGDVEGITLGEEGRGRKEVFIPSTFDIKKGMNESLDIGKTKTNRPRVVATSEDTLGLYMIINTHGGYTRRGNGFASVTDINQITVIERANGADGDAGRIGTWDSFLLKVNSFEKDLMVILWYSGGYEQEFLLVRTNGTVESFKTLAEFALWLDIGNTTTLDLAMFDFEKEKVRKCRFI